MRLRYFYREPSEAELRESRKPAVSRRRKIVIEAPVPFEEICDGKEIGCRLHGRKVMGRSIGKEDNGPQGRFIYIKLVSDGAERVIKRRHNPQRLFLLRALAV